MKPSLTKQCVAEFIGTFTLIFIGIGAIANNSPGSGVGLLGVALAHGLAIAVMVSATGGISGGHLNPAVTFGLLIGGKICPSRTIAYWIAQLAGATAAALLCGYLLGNAAVQFLPHLALGEQQGGSKALRLFLQVLEEGLILLDLGCGEGVPG